jgi:hypothetical protein
MRPVETTPGIGGVEIKENDMLKELLFIYFLI